jgi:multiple sugar transport system ATP-binding protein
MGAVTLRNVSKSFGAVDVIRDVNIEIVDGEFVILVGPSGCGKSTLLRMIAGLEEVTSGSVLIDAAEITHVPPRDRDIAMVFQNYALYPHFTVEKNMGFALKLAGVPKDQIKAQVATVAESLGLTSYLDRYPKELSGGQRQRVATGRAIVRNPKVFLFDEPLSNLDAALRGDMRVELSQLHRELGATMVYVTHDQVEAMTMADRIVVLNGGRIEPFGTPMELYHHPQTRFVATFIGQPNMNLVPATVRGTSAEGLAVEMDGGHLMTIPVDGGSARPGDRVEVGIRPENVELGQGLSMSVRVLERLGGVSITYGEVGGVRFCAALPGDAPVSEGASIGMSVDPRHVHVFDASGNVLRRQAAPALVA